MLNNKVVPEADQVVPPIGPELLQKLKKEDMEQAVVERFKNSVEEPEHRTAARHGVRTSAWRSADDEC
jgi:hypothetical protein